MSTMDDLREAQKRVDALEEIACSETRAELNASVPAPWKVYNPSGGNIDVAGWGSLVYIYVERTAEGRWAAGAHGIGDRWTREWNAPDAGAHATPRAALVALAARLSRRGRAELCLSCLRHMGICE